MGECGFPGQFNEEGGEDAEGDEDLGLSGEDEPVDTDELNPVKPEELGDDEAAEEDSVEDGDLEGEDLDDDEFGFDDEDEDFDDEEGLDDEDFGDEDLGGEEGLDDGDELGDEDDFSAGEDEDPEIELDENIVKKFRQLVRESINEMFGDTMSEPEEGEDDDEDDEEETLEEAKAAKMNSIVESVVSDILNEDELHVFGDHPGYRKKPMTLPQTGEDKFQVNRDWNDDSVHSEEPFGKGKGDSTPFDQLVAQITDSVMKQINENKKKVK
jgi:hypothetical protein